MTASITAYSAISCPCSCDQNFRSKSVMFAPPKQHHCLDLPVTCWERMLSVNLGMCDKRASVPPPSAVRVASPHVRQIKPALRHGHSEIQERCSHFVSPYPPRLQEHYAQRWAHVKPLISSPDRHMLATLWPCWAIWFADARCCNAHPMAKKKDPAAVELGRKGGTASAKKLTSEQRKEKARKAAQARWVNKKAQ
jgi:hypothetical protein